jgi:carbon-monoxide dehydrogenase small subunit
MPVRVSCVVNGTAVSAEVETRTLLVDFLRHELRLTGTHVGCDTSQCGACVVHFDGRAIKSCSLLAVQAEGAAITTIEGLAASAGAVGRTGLHPMQAAFRAEHGLQCGFCTPGMIMTAVELVTRNPDPSEAEVRAGLEGNLCRCTGYHNIVKAVLAAAAEMRAGPPSAAPAGAGTAQTGAVSAHV